MPIQITPINAEDIPSAARCIQRAFKEDPYFQWVFDSSNVKKYHYCLMFYPGSMYLIEPNSTIQSAISPP